MQSTRLAVALALACVLAGSTGAAAQDAEPRPRSLLQRVALKGSAVHMAPSEPALGAAPAEEVTDEYVLLKDAMPGVPAPRAFVEHLREQPIVFVEHLKSGMRRTYTAMLVQKVLSLRGNRTAEEPHLQHPGQQASGTALVAQEPTTQSPIIILLSLLIWISVLCVCAHYYNKQYEMPVSDGSAGDFKMFKHNVFACHEEPGTCLLACFCPGMRWAQTMFLGGFLTFWGAFGMFTGSNMMSSFPGGEIFGLLMFGAMTFYRQKMRETFDMHEQGGCTILQDFCCFCWCTPCVITQEARQIEDAYKAGHPAMKEVVPELF